MNVSPIRAITQSLTHPERVLRRRKHGKLLTFFDPMVMENTKKLGEVHDVTDISSSGLSQSSDHSAPSGARSTTPDLYPLREIKTTLFQLPPKTRSRFWISNFNFTQDFVGPYQPATTALLDCNLV
jgi:hypothetical protein